MSRLLAAQRALTVPGWAKDELSRKAQAIPSLDLRFAENKSLVDATTGSNLVTFTRASSGTFVGSDGVLRTAVTNLLLRSEEFNDASWTKSGATVSADQIASPIGSVTADKLIESAANAEHWAGRLSLGLPSAIYTCSIYAKAAERQSLSIFIDTSVTRRTAYFNLSNGTLGSISTGITSSIQNIGNGWYRCSITLNAAEGMSNAVYTAAIGNSNIYLGDGTSGIYLWGAQLEQSATVGEYIPTTSTINSAPRFDHNPTTGESLGLLVEEQRSNLLLNSGTLSTQSVTVTAVAHTLSFTGTGTITLTGTSTAGPLVGTGTGEANRVSLTFTPTAGSLTLTVSGTITNAQLEVGAFRTSYISTTAAAATRSADVATITGTAFSRWYNSTTGTLFAEAASSTGAAYSGYVATIGQDFLTSIQMFRQSDFQPVGRIRNLATDEYGPVGNGVVWTGTTPNRFALAWSPTSGRQASNGALSAVADDTSITTHFANKMTIGALAPGPLPLNGTIRRLTYWGQRLPNNILQAITQ